MAADPIDPALVKRAVELCQRLLTPMVSGSLAGAAFDQVCEAALDSLTQRDLVREQSEACAELKRELRAALSVLGSAQQDRDQLRSELDRAQRAEHEALSLIDECDAVRARLHSENATLRFELDAAQRLAETRERMATAAVQLGEKVGELQQELEVAREKIEKRDLALVEVHGELDALQRELEAARAERDQANKLPCEFEDGHASPNVDGCFHSCGFTEGARRMREMQIDQLRLDLETEKRLHRAVVTAFVSGQREREELRTQLSTAQADAQRLREALRPFARVADERPDYEKNDRLVTHGMTLGHCRAARAALEGRGEEG